jgi:nitrogenase-associated protein
MADAAARDLPFWEKPGCQGNQRQKQLLRQQGFDPRVKDLLAHPWTASELRSFFIGKPVADWFNRSAPAITSGEINPDELDGEMALSLMMLEPILIRRPLMSYGEFKQAGFESGEVFDALDIALNSKRNLDGCPMAAGEMDCDA